MAPAFRVVVLSPARARFAQREPCRQPRLCVVAAVPQMAFSITSKGDQEAGSNGHLAVVV